MPGTAPRTSLGRESEGSGSRSITSWPVAEAMCGIAGLVGSMDSAQARAAVTSMVHKLVRRGPDGEGIQSWPDAVLGHRRLAIYDLSPAGHQPMTLSDGSVSVVFN